MPTSELPSKGVNRRCAILIYTKEFIPPVLHPVITGRVPDFSSKETPDHPIVYPWYLAYETPSLREACYRQNGNASCIVSKVLTRHYNHWLGPTHSFKGTPRTFLRLWPRKMPVNEFVEQTEQKFRLCPMSPSLTESSLHMSHRYKVM